LIQINERHENRRGATILAQLIAPLADQLPLQNHSRCSMAVMLYSAGPLKECWIKAGKQPAGREQVALA
jgi:hypothetical protein